jgi:nucleotide-binding universal stress UspA family protein
MFERILIPTDGSAFCQPALEHGLNLAKMTGGEVTLLFALDDLYEELGYGAELKQETRDSYKVQSRLALAMLEERMRAEGVVAHSVVIEDYPVHAILEAAKNHDLVIMATHNRKGFERALHGSVTDKVVHNCSTPVLVVWGDAKAVN